MKKIKYYLSSILFVCAASLALVSCGDDDYESAPKVGADNVGAYFSSSNAADVVLTPEEYNEDSSVRLLVKRAGTKGDVTVPVVVDRADAEFKIPANVEFKDGEDEAILTIDFPGLKFLQTYKFTIHLDESATNPYKKVDGSTVFNYTVTVARWMKVVEGATFSYEGNIFPSVKSDIYQLEGQNKFYVENFLGSDINLGFYIIPQDANGTWTVDAFSAADRATWKGIFMPSDHYLKDAEYDYWYLMKDADTEDYASWTPEGSSLGIDYINFYLDTSADNFASIDMNGSSTSFAGFLTPYIYYSDGNTSGYTYIYMYWDENNIPSAE